jgi:hypothetical protein
MILPAIIVNDLPTISVVSKQDRQDNEIMVDRQLMLYYYVLF